MLTAQSPISSNPTKTGRKPLQPKNSPISSSLKPKQADSKWSQISLVHNWNKENIHPLYATTPAAKIKQLEASLAEELSSIRRKLERMRVEKEKTENLLRERDRVLDLQMKELQTRGEMQKQLEIEVDRLFRLKELRLSCMRISPIRSLRDEASAKECQGRSVTGNDNQSMKAESEQITT